MRMIGFVGIAVALGCGLSMGAGIGAAAEAAEDGWRDVEVPPVWKRPVAGRGFVWYRCRVVVPAGWAGRELTFFLEPADDAREVFINGVRIGGSGVFPPAYRSGLGGPERFAVDPAAVGLRVGEANDVAVRVYNHGGRLGFNVAAPVLFGGGEGIRLDGKWGSRVGEGEVSWAAGKRSGTGDAVAGWGATFQTVEPADELERTLKRLGGDDRGPLAPLESLALLETADDLAVDLVLSEPEIGQPLSIKFDPRGRLWVMQYLQYPDPAGLGVVSRDKFLRAVYDGVPEPPPGGAVGRDRITVHEDSDGDGAFDRHGIFLDGLNIATSFALGRGGVWVLNPPYLLFYADRDGDDRPDGDGAPKVHLEGFGLEDSHSVANSLRWGPDGWLYAAQGSTVTGRVKRPGAMAGEAVRSMGQLIWRYHPERRRYEVFAEGGGNAFGVEIDAGGRVFSGHNGGDTRGFHYVQGGYYRKGFGKHGPLSNPNTFGYFEAMAHAKVPRFTHTFAVYEEEGLPASYRGKLFAVAPLQGHVVLSARERDGSTFKTRDEGHPLASGGDTWFRPVDIQPGPDGALYVADFYEQRIDHASHYQGRVHRGSGRIYRVRAKSGEGNDAARRESFNYAALTTPELIALLDHPSRWHRQTALRLLGDRRDPAAVPPLREKLRRDPGPRALEALWALHLSGGLDEGSAWVGLGHPQAAVRRWAARLLGDPGEALPAAVVDTLVAAASSETDPEVRSQMASTARRLPTVQALQVLAELLWREADAADPHIPLLLWWVVDTVIGRDKGGGEGREAVLQFLADPDIDAWDSPLVKEHLAGRLMRRLARSGKRADLRAAARLFALAPGEDEARRLLAGFEQGFSGRGVDGLPPELAGALDRAGGGSLALRLRRGEAGALDAVLSRVADPKAPDAERAGLVAVLGELKLAAGDHRVRAALLAVAAADADAGVETSVRAAALNALRHAAGPEVAAAVLGLLPDLTDELRAAAFGLLASRRTWAEVLLRAVGAGEVEAGAVPGTAVAQLRLVAAGDAGLSAQVDQHWGGAPAVRPGGASDTSVRGALASGIGNPYLGRELYRHRCGACHALFGLGGDIGPDLTAYQREDLGALLRNILDPGAEVREGYRQVVIATRDGRALAGFLAEEDGRAIVLRGIAGGSTTVPVEDIASRQELPGSPMPPGLLDGLTDQQLRDFFAFLRSPQPLP